MYQLQPIFGDPPDIRAAAGPLLNPDFTADR
jgi:hypothetical protein